MHEKLDSLHKTMDSWLKHGLTLKEIHDKVLFYYWGEDGKIIFLYWMKKKKKNKELYDQFMKTIFF